MRTLAHRFMSALRPRRRRVDVLPFVFAFLPVTQFGLIAGSFNRLAESHSNKIVSLAGKLATEALRTAAVTGYLGRWADLEVQLITIPVNVAERESGRVGLVVTLGVAIAGPKKLSAALRMQVMAALEYRIAIACNAEADGPTATADVLARCLQEPGGNSTRVSLDRSVAVLADYFTCIAGQEPNGAGGYVELHGATSNLWHSDPARLMGYMLSHQSRRARAAVVGYYLDLRAPQLCAMAVSGKVLSHLFVNDHLMMCVEASASPGGVESALSSA